MSNFTDAIAAAQLADRPPSNRATPPIATAETGTGPEVQLSVRLPEGLRTAVTQAATSLDLTVTAFVKEALRRAVAEASDSFVGLAEDLARNVRAELRSAVQAGAYRDAADEVERQEAWS